MHIPSRFKTNTSSFAHYWSKGIGVDLLSKLEVQPDLENAKKIIPYLYQFDEKADEIVQQIHQKVGFAKGQQIIRTYLKNSNEVELPYKNILDEFFKTVELSPDCVDWDKIKQGIALSQRSGLSGLIVLRDYCLMGGYESSAINKPLIYTGALKKGAVKRLSETVDFWVDITADHGLDKGNIGFQKIIETRMIHSFSRINILQKTDWKTDDWGIPLNQWDMLATNLGFSLVFLVGLKRMKFEILAEEIDGVIHLWRYIGTLLGIDISLLPKTEEEAIEALYYWTMTQKEGDQDSKLLAHALQEEPIQAYFPQSAFGRKIMREVHLFYNHYLLGSYSCRLLALDKTVIGSFAYLNILKNKFENKKIKIPEERNLLIKKGRAKHEEVKRIYLTYNNKENNSK